MSKRKCTIADIAATTSMEETVDWHSMTDEDIAALATYQAEAEQAESHTQKLLSRLLHSQTGKLWQALLDRGELTVQVPAHEVRTLKQRVINTKQRYNALLKKLHRLDEQEKRVITFTVNYLSGGDSAVSMTLDSGRSGQPLTLTVLDSEVK